MKSLFSFSSVTKKILASTLLIATALAVPFASANAAAVKIEGSIGVANVTAGDTKYAHGVNATFDQVVKFQVYYHNMELEDSGKIAENLRVKVAIPSTPGSAQKVTATIAGTNTNTVTDTATVNINRSDAYLQYIPGSAVWKHNKGTNESVNIVEEKISDDVVLNGSGLVLENAKPCYNFDATVTVLARVVVPSVKIVKESRVKGSGNAWSNNNTAKPGETLEYKITYQNIGNTKQTDVVIRDSLPPSMQYVKGSTKLYNSTNPSGLAVLSDNITNGGIIIGGYNPGGGAYVYFDAKMPDASATVYKCGDNEFRNVAIAKPSGLSEFYNTAITKITKECEQKPTPKYSCDALTVETFTGRKIKATVKYTAKDGATFNTVMYDFGDQTNKLVTDKTTVEHTYAKDGQYTIKATVNFLVDGKPVSDSGDCNKTVKFESEKPVPPVTPPTTPTPTPEPELPNTGVGSIVGLFAGISLLGALGHRLWMARR